VPSTIAPTLQTHDNFSVHGFRCRLSACRNSPIMVYIGLRINRSCPGKKLMQEAAMLSRHWARTHRGVVQRRRDDLAVGETNPPRRKVPAFGRAAAWAGLAERFHEISQIGQIEITPTDLILRSRATRGVSKDGCRTISHGAVLRPSRTSGHAHPSTSLGAPSSGRGGWIVSACFEPRSRWDLRGPAPTIPCYSLLRRHPLPVRATRFPCSRRQGIRSKLFKSLSRLRPHGPEWGLFLRDSLIKSLIAGNSAATAPWRRLQPQAQMVRRRGG
jgi:hypothetical protein